VAVRKVRRSTLGGDVLTALTHYETMVRRHIVTDSDIAKLCRDLYRAHQKAFDLILEHRPDQQGDMRDALEQVVRSHSRFDLDHSSKSYVRFFLKKWDEDERLRTGTAWTGTGRVLLFELQNFPESLRLKLIVGPGEADIRQRIFEFAKVHKDLYRGITSKLYPKFTQVYARVLVEKDDFDAPPEEVIRQATTTLSSLFEGDIAQLTSSLQEILRHKD
jgi:hypothetical protein